MQKIYIIGVVVDKEMEEIKIIIMKIEIMIIIIMIDKEEIIEIIIEIIIKIMIK